MITRDAVQRQVLNYVHMLADFLAYECHIGALSTARAPLSPVTLQTRDIALGLIRMFDQLTGDNGLVLAFCYLKAHRSQGYADYVLGVLIDGLLVDGEPKRELVDG